MFLLLLYVSLPIVSFAQQINVVSLYICLARLATEILNVFPPAHCIGSVPAEDPFQLENVTFNAILLLGTIGNWLSEIY